MSRTRRSARCGAQIDHWARDQRFRALNADDCAPSIPPWAPKWLRSRLRAARDDLPFQSWLGGIRLD